MFQVQLLHCIVQTKSQGGANQFSDGFRAAEQLRERNPEYFKILTEVPVEFLDLGSDFISFDRRATHRTIRSVNCGSLNLFQKP
jgi:gamma-butyrobetaine dioxygenase